MSVMFIVMAVAGTLAIIAAIAATWSAWLEYEDPILAIGGFVLALIGGAFLVGAVAGVFFLWGLAFEGMA